MPSPFVPRTRKVRILATLGRVEPEARKHNQGIELLDGATLWPLIDPLLPPSLREWLPPEAIDGLFAEIARTAVPGAVVCFRTTASGATETRAWQFWLPAPPDLSAFMSASG